jgi:antitoxin ParD1/3/4
MGEVISVSISDELAAFVGELIQERTYESETAVVEVALHLLKEDYEVRIEALRAAIEEGEASGEPQPFDFEEFLARMHSKHTR